jgi:hypothetical protein
MGYEMVIDSDQNCEMLDANVIECESENKISPVCVLISSAVDALGSPV